MKKRTFWIRGQDHKAVREVTGYEFEASGVALVVHREGGGYWQVSEPITGAHVHAGNTRAEAMEFARERLVHNNNTYALRKRIEMWGPPK